MPLLKLIPGNERKVTMTAPLFNCISWNCPLCGTQSIHRSLATHDYNHKLPGTFFYGKCTGCSLWRQEPRPDDATLGNGYPLHYGSSPDAKNDPYKRIYCYANKQRFMFASKVVGTSPSVFDIGCGSGFFLAYLRDRSFRVAGIDSAEEHVVYANNTLLLPNVSTASWPGYRANGAKYDLVSLIHVLEHLPDPVGGLREAAQLLSPRGYLLIETPNIDAFPRYVFGSRCNLFDAPRHLCLFSQSTLITTVKAAGLMPVRLITYSPSTDGYRESLRYLLKDLRLRRYQTPQETVPPQPAPSPDRRGNGAISLLHSVETYAERAIDYVACRMGAGLTLLALVKKGDA